MASQSKNASTRARMHAPCSACVYAYMHAEIDRQPKNTMPPDQSITGPICKTDRDITIILSYKNEH